MKNLRKLLTGSLAAAVCFSFITVKVGAQQQPKPWVIPDNYKTMKNPIAKTEKSINAGKALYNTNCASCHGRNGLGDGVKARMLKEFPGDFATAAFQNQTDGEHFYKTKTGRGEMPKYEGKLSDDDIWNIVNYMRTFKK